MKRAPHSVCEALQLLALILPQSLTHHELATQTKPYAFNLQSASACTISFAAAYE